MLGFNRLAKEDYVFMGRVEVWTLWDAVCLLTSFEMESTGAFGETEDLLKFERIKNGRDLEGPEKVFHATWDKWNMRLMAAMASPGVLPYANILDEKEIENSEVDFVDCCSSFRARDLFGYLVSRVAKGGESLDLNILQDYLLGKGNAPAREVVESVAVSMASKRHAASKPFKEALRGLIDDYFSGGCRCTSKTAFEELKKQWRNEAEMKAEVKVGYYSLNELVKDALAVLEKDDPEKVVRRNQAKGYSKEKICTSCPKHRRTILK